MTLNAYGYVNRIGRTGCKIRPGKVSGYVCDTCGNIDRHRPEGIECARQSYWEFMRNGGAKGHPASYDPETPMPQSMWDVYLAGSLRNPAIPNIMSSIHEGANAKVFADWYAAGPEADDHWKAFYQGAGYTYREALREPASVNTFQFDKRNMEMSRVMVLALPAGKSGHLELGWFLGMGKPGYILLDSDEDRWDVMYQFATGVTADRDELNDWIRKDLA